jgi:ATP adenylyltransferase
MTAYAGVEGRRFGAGRGSDSSRLLTGGFTGQPSFSLSESELFKFTLDFLSHIPSANLSLCMDYLWTPWRYAYVSGAEKAVGCVFCNAAQADDDEKNLIVHRGKRCFVILNAFPYTAGHVMIVPYAHVDELRKLPPDAATEMMSLSQRLESTLRDLYHPDGVNLGMNIGKAAGAGIAGHIHMHILPRWVADANFMTVVGETRILPEALEETWKRLTAALRV